MKAKRILAVFLFALLAMTVIGTAGIAISPKAAAQPFAFAPPPSAFNYEPIKYVAGKTYTYGPSQFNQHDTGHFDVPVEGFHFERSSKGTVTTLLGQTATQSGWNYALAGMWFRLTDFTEDDLAQPCTATMQVTYVLAARGDHGTGAEFYPDAYGLPNLIVDVFGDDSQPFKIVTTTITYTGTVGEFFLKETAYSGFFLVEMSCWHNPTIDGSAFASASISSITVSFPAAGIAR